MQVLAQAKVLLVLVEQRDWGKEAGRAIYCSSREIRLYSKS